MAEKLEMPMAQITRLVREGAYDSLTSTAANRNPQSLNAPDGDVIIGKDTKHAFQQISGLFIMYIAST